MTDAVPHFVRAQLHDPFAELSGSLATARKLDLQVVTAEKVSPNFRSVTLTSPDLDGFRFSPGQDIMLLVATDGRRPVRRRYTIRSFDPAALTVTVTVALHEQEPCRHGADDRRANDHNDHGANDHGAGSRARAGQGPGERWIRAATPGDRIEGIGPRGKITTRPGADWHLFIGDASAMSAILTMTESLPGDADATLLIEVPGPADEQDFLAPARTRTSWLHRLHRNAGDPALLAAEAAEVELPPGDGHAYLFGEAALVLRLREILTARGLRQSQLSAKSYWGQGRPNAGHGEPAQVPEATQENVPGA